MAMTDIEVRPSIPEDAIFMGENMRECDRQEIAAFCGMKPFQAVDFSIRISEKSWTGLVSGEIVVIFGVSSRSILSRRGMPWLYGTDKFGKTHNYEFLQCCRPYLAQMEEGFELLDNYVDVRNTSAIRWLKWLGFTMKGPTNVGPFQRPFYWFYKEIKQCAPQLSAQ